MPLKKDVKNHHQHATLFTPPFDFSRISHLPAALWRSITTFPQFLERSPFSQQTRGKKAGEIQMEKEIGSW